MRLRCLFGLHEWEPAGEVAPPPEWQHPPWIEFENAFGRPAAKPQWKGLPTFHLKQCVHCPASSYDMVWPEGTVPPL
jgi:hypothetical protein